MEDADGSATPPGAGDADADAPRADRPRNPGEGAPADAVRPPLALRPEGADAERSSALASSWRSAAGSPDARVVRALYRRTLRFALQNEWRSLEEPLREELVASVRECGDALRRARIDPVEERRVRHLELVARDPWHHPVPREIARGAEPEPREVRRWVAEEGSGGAVERLELLCAAGGKLESAALRLALALTPSPPILPAEERDFALEALLVLSWRARRTAECVSRIKALEVNEAVALVSGLATRNRSSGRIWKDARHAAAFCAQILLATHLVRPLEGDRLGTLAALLASLYSECPEELPPTLRKLLVSADTAAHVYVVCGAVERQFGSAMRPFVCELYVRALTSGVNELERQRHRDETGRCPTAARELAGWFLSLAELLSANRTVRAECALTAFSLHPSKFFYRKLREFGAGAGDARPPAESSRVAGTAPSSISPAVLEGEGLGLGADLCRDLAMLLSGPRLKYLTWDLGWEKLSQYCLSYMADTEEGTKSLTTELKYVRLDYSQFEIKPREERDVYFGIEKGYEHHLELDEDEDSDPEPAPDETDDARRRPARPRSTRPDGDRNVPKRKTPTKREIVRNGSASSTESSSETERAEAALSLRDADPGRPPGASFFRERRTDPREETSTPAEDPRGRLFAPNAIFPRSLPRDDGPRAKSSLLLYRKPNGPRSRTGPTGAPAFESSALSSPSVDLANLDWEKSIERKIIRVPDRNRELFRPSGAAGENPPADGVDLSLGTNRRSFSRLRDGLSARRDARPASSRGFENDNPLLRKMLSGNVTFREAISETSSLEPSNGVDDALRERASENVSDDDVPENARRDESAPGTFANVGYDANSLSEFLSDVIENVRIEDATRSNIENVKILKIEKNLDSLESLNGDSAKSDSFVENAPVYECCDDFRKESSFFEESIKSDEDIEKIFKDFIAELETKRFRNVFEKCETVEMMNDPRIDDVPNCPSSTGGESEPKSIDDPNVRTDSREMNVDRVESENVQNENVETESIRNVPMNNFNENDVSANSDDGRCSTLKSTKSDRNKRKRGAMPKRARPPRSKVGTNPSRKIHKTAPDSSRIRKDLRVVLFNLRTRSDLTVTETSSSSSSSSPKLPEDPRLNLDDDANVVESSDADFEDASETCKSVSRSDSPSPSPPPDVLPDESHLFIPENASRKNDVLSFDEFDDLELSLQSFTLKNPTVATENANKDENVRRETVSVENDAPNDDIKMDVDIDDDNEMINKSNTCEKFEFDPTVNETATVQCEKPEMKHTNEKVYDGAIETAIVQSEKSEMKHTDEKVYDETIETAIVESVKSEMIHTDEKVSDGAIVECEKSETIRADEKVHDGAIETMIVESEISETKRADEKIHAEVIVLDDDSDDDMKIIKIVNAPKIMKMANAPKKTDSVIIELSDDDDVNNSDVEIVDSNDPIAIDVNLPTDKIDAVAESPVPTPSFVTLLDDSISRERVERRASGKGRNALRQFILFYGENKTITARVPIADWERLHVPCKVAVKPFDISKFLKMRTIDLKYADGTDVKLKKITNSKIKSKTCIRTKSPPKFQLNTKVQTRSKASKVLNNFDTCHKDSLFYESEDREEKFNVDSLTSINVKNEFDDRNGNGPNPDVVTAGDKSKIEKIALNKMKNSGKSENAPDILHRPDSNVRYVQKFDKCDAGCVSFGDVSKSDKENFGEFKNCRRPSPCPDLLDKTDGSHAVMRHQPDIVLSNENKNRASGKYFADIGQNQESAVKKSLLNVKNDYADEPSSVKTYTNCAQKPKRKTRLAIAIKKFRNNPKKKIDLPKVSQEDIGSITHKLNIDERQSYDRAFNLSIKELFMREAEEEFDAIVDGGRIKENLDANLSDVDCLKGSNSSECPRSSFYSSIFDDFDSDKYESIENYIRKCEKHEIIENNFIGGIKCLKRGKGFGIRSGRGNIKDPLRGRFEGPAAVLSDTTTTRPPLALHNFSACKRNNEHRNNANNQSETSLKKSNPDDNENDDNSEKELNNNLLNKLHKSIIKNFMRNLCNITNENLYNDVFKHKDNGFNRKNDRNFRSDAIHKINNLYDKNVFARVPGMADLDFVRPYPNNAVVQVVQIGQSPVTSGQQNSLTAVSTTSPQTAAGEYMDVSGNNSVEYRSPPDDELRQASGSENDLSELKENENSENKRDAENNETNSEENPMNLVDDRSHINHVQVSGGGDPNVSVSQIGILNQITLEKSETLDFSEQNSGGSNFTNSVQIEEKDALPTDSAAENQTNNIPSTAASFISNSRGQTLVNLLSQKIIHSPVTGQHVQMTIPKGTVNALSLQQALAQVLPPPLSQSSNDTVIQSASHSSAPQVVHIVQGKGNSQTPNSFGSLLVDSGQSTVMSSPGTTQVLHIVQGKPGSNPGSSAVLGQTQVSGATFGGLSIVDSNAQQVGNQVLHIVNAGVQNKNNTTQVLKRVNLLTNITNPQGNNEQKMVQFVCKSSDGKPIQLNAQHQRGMVLRLQPIDNSNFSPAKSVESQASNANISTVQTVTKSQSDQTQELKSRSVYEENYAKFIQNSSQIMPSSPEKSTALPKFNQVFGKSVFQDNNPVNKTNDNIEQSQSPSVSISNDQQSSQDLTTLNIGQLGHINSPPLLIRKSGQPNIVHQNVVQQMKQSVTPMNIQTIHGGVIYTRQIPVNTINLITVPNTDVIDEVQLQNIQKQSQEKNSAGEQQIESQVVKIVSQDQQSNASVVMDSSSDDANQTFTDQTPSHVNAHPLLTQMRIKVPMVSKSGSQMVTGTRVVRPVLQIQRNLIPGTNPAVYQQLVLTTAPAIRQPIPAPVAAIRPSRPASAATHQESNLSSSTLEQLREFDMVLEQVKERSTVQPGSSSSSTFSDSSPQRQVIENNADIDSAQTSVSHAPQREVLYSIGPQTVNVAYVNQKVISKTTQSVLTTSYASSDSNISTVSSQNSPSSQVSHGLVNTITHSKPCTSSTKVNSKPVKTKPKPANPTSSNASKPNPVPTKTSLQKPLEDEQTTQRILYILAEYKEQVENSPDKDKPAPRRRSNPPTNPTTSSKRKKSSGGSSKKSTSGQSLQEMSPIGGDDAGHTMGSEDSSCGLSQGECTDNSVQGPDNQSPQASPQKAVKKLLFQPDSDLSSTSQLQQQQQPQPQQQQQPPQRNVIIADGQTITMTRPNTGKATAVLMPANYILPMSMVKGGQQIAIVTNQGPKILSVPHGEGNTTNALFLQRLVGPAGLKPMLTRPGQVRHVRLPANTVQNLQAFNLSPNTSINSQDGSWINNNSINNTQPKLIVEYGASLSNNSDLNPDSVKSEISDTQSLKDDNVSLNSEHVSSVKLEDSTEPSSENRLEDNMTMAQVQATIQDSNLPNISEHVLQQVHVPKSTGNATLNLIQVHSLNSSDCGKLFSVQSSSGLNSLLQLSDKSPLNQTLRNLNNDGESSPPNIQDSTQGIVIGKQGHLESQFLSPNKNDTSHDGETDLKLSDINSLEDNLSIPDDLPGGGQQNFVLSGQSDKCHAAAENHSSWSTNGTVARDNNSPFGYENSSPRLTNQDDNQDADMTEVDDVRGLSENVTSRVLRHAYSPSSSPTGPRHLYHKMFISTPIKKTFGSEVEHTVSSVDEDKQYVQVLDIRHPDEKTCSAESLDVTNVVQSSRNSLTQNSSSIHNAASLRHKYAVMEHELRLQKSLSEECEDLGVDSPSASDLFPEAELLFAASPSSQFDQSQDGCILTVTNHSSPSTTNINSSISHQIGSSSSLSTNISRESRILTEQAMDVVEESEFARMHPNTTFHSGEIELVSDDADDASINISFSGAGDKQALSQSRVASKRGEIVRSVIEGIGSSGGIASFSQSKLTSQFSMVDHLSRRVRNPLSSLQCSDDYSEGAEDSMNSAESKEALINKGLDGILSDEIVKRDLTLSSAESPMCISSNIIQRNVTQVIRHAGSDPLTLSGNDPDKLCNANANDLSQNDRNFLLENSSNARSTTESGILKSIMLERDGRDALTCSSPEQHSELFWESNSNSNQSEEHLPVASSNLLDFSSEDSNKCCKSPLSCEETNSTDSSSLGGHNPQSHNSHHPLRLNSVIKSSGGNSSAADGPILHNALISNNPNMNQDSTKKLPINLNNIHKSDSNTSSSPEEDANRIANRRNWGRAIKGSSGRGMISPRSLSVEINMGTEIETSSSEGINILTKSTSGIMMHSGSSTPEESSGNNRRLSLRGPGGVKRPCHCCSGTPPTSTSTSTSTSSTSRRTRRRPPPLH